MKILQIGDLHLGKVVNGFPMLEDQKYILKQVVNTLKVEHIDVLVITGDIYDRSIAPVDAVECWSQFLEQLSSFEVEVFIINGNHDSLKRISFASKIFENSNIHIVSDNILFRKYTIDSIDFYLLPYLSLEQASVIVGQKITDFNSLKQLILNEIELDDNQTNIIVDHSYIITGEHDLETDSAIRPLSLGGSEFTDGVIYNQFDLVLAGHIHRHSYIRPNIYYSGSILPYSSGERDNRQGYYIHTIGKTISSKYYNFKLLHPMRLVELYIDQVSDHQYSEDYVIVKLLDDGQVINPLERLRSKYPNVMQIERNFRTVELSAIPSSDTNSIEQSFIDFYNLNSEDEISEESLQFFTQTIEQVLEGERNETT